MTKHFCDLCGKEIYSINKLPMFISTTATKQYEVDACKDCLKEVVEKRQEADVNIYNEMKNKKPV